MVPEATQPPERPDDYGAVLLFGGAMHADHESAHPWLLPEKVFLRELLEREVPILAVCLGAQLLAEAAGGPPRRAARPEIGWHDVELTAEGSHDPLLGSLAPRFEAFQWHSYQFPLPPSATALARSPICLQAYRIGELAWGIQFHAEVTAADAESWIADYRSDADAVAIGLDEEGLLDRTREKIGPWNELGRALCERFLDAISTRA
jgi:GMP synthase-like glutamine amidotransferase